MFKSKYILGFLLLTSCQLAFAASANPETVLEFVMQGMAPTIGKLTTLAISWLGVFAFLQFVITNFGLLKSDSDIQTVIAKCAGAIAWVGVVLYIINNGPEFIQSVGDEMMEITGFTLPTPSSIFVNTIKISGLMAGVAVAASAAPGIGDTLGLVLFIFSLIVLCLGLLFCFKIFMLQLEIGLVAMLSPISFAFLGLNTLKDQGIAPFKSLLSFAYRVILLAVILSGFDGVSDLISQILDEIKESPVRTIVRKGITEIVLEILSALGAYGLLGFLAWKSDSIAASLSSGSTSLGNSDIAGAAAAGAAAGAVAATAGAAAMAGAAQAPQSMANFMSNLGGGGGSIKNASSMGSGGPAPAPPAPPNMSRSGGSAGSAGSGGGATGQSKGSSGAAPASSKPPAPKAGSSSVASGRYGGGASDASAQSTAGSDAGSAKTEATNDSALGQGQDSGGMASGGEATVPDTSAQSGGASATASQGATSAAPGAETASKTNAGGAPSASAPQKANANTAGPGGKAPKQPASSSPGSTANEVSVTPASSSSGASSNVTSATYGAPSSPAPQKANATGSGGGAPKQPESSGSSAPGSGATAAIGGSNDNKMQETLDKISEALDKQGPKTPTLGDRLGEANRQVERERDTTHVSINTHNTD